jgi:TP901 family phage tail tape measure protein
MASVAKIIIQAIDKASNVFGKIGEKGRNVADNITKYFGGLQQVGTNLSAIGAAGGLALSIVAKSAANVNDVLDDTMSMTGLTGKKYDDMKEKLKDMSRKMSNAFGVDQTDIVKAYYYVLSTGVKAGTDGFKKLTEAALMLNKVTGLETAQGVEALGKILKIFGKNATDAGKAANVLFVSSRQGMTTVPELAEAMGIAGKAANNMGVDMNTTAALLVALSDKGTKAADAGNSLKRIFLRIAAAGPKAAKELENIGVKMYDSQGKMRPIVDILVDLQKATQGMTDKQKIFTLKLLAGQHAYTDLAGLMDTNLSKVRDNAKETRNISAVQDSFNKKLENAVGQFNLLKVKIQNIVAVMGEKLLPVIKPVIAEIDGMVSSLGKWIEKNPETSASIMTVVAALTAMAVVIGPILVAIGMLGPGIGALSGAFTAIGGVLSAVGAALAANPIAIAIMAIVAAITAFAI